MWNNASSFDHVFDDRLGPATALKVALRMRAPPSPLVDDGGFGPVKNLAVEFFMVLPNARIL